MPVNLRQTFSSQTVSTFYSPTRGFQQICSSSRVYTYLLSPSGPASNDEGITNPICGDGLIVPRRQGASFFCRPSLFGQYVTIRSIRSDNVELTLCEVEVYSERRGT